MASGSNQPFCHNTLARQTDRPTDGTGDNDNVSIPRALMLYYIDRKRHAEM